MTAQASTVPAPPGFEPIRELSGSATSRVSYGRWRGREVVCRAWTTRDDDGQDLAELAVLAAAEHEGLARLVDHGPLPGGGAYLLREWIEGSELDAWARGRHASEIGAVVARLCAGLDALHRDGFVHADLKPSNVLVRPDGRPVLTDFGLARRVGAAARAAGVSGTLFAIAPEVLAGAAPDARADLFALGVLLHQLLVPARPTARAFYARFPGESFFAATQSRPEDLPAWARDLVETLVARSPDERPASAASVGRALAARLGVLVPGLASADELRFPATQGRRKWIAALVAEVSRAGSLWLELPAGEEPDPLLDAIRLAASLEGEPMAVLDLGAEVGALTDDGALDTWALRRAAELGERVALLRAAGRDPWATRAAGYLARTRAQRGPAATIAAASAPAPDDGTWETRPVPAVDADAIRRWLSERFEPGEPQRLGELARRLADAGRGSATRVAELVARLCAEGHVLFGDERARLRPGALPELRDAALEVGALPLDEDARRLAAALAIADGRAPAAELDALAGLENGRAAVGWLALQRAGVVALERGPRGRVVRLAAGRASDLRTLVRPDAWRAMHAERAEHLAARHAPEALVLPHLWAAAEGDAEREARAVRALRDELRRLREAGCAELGLEMLDRLERQVGAGEALPLALRAERAFAWCALGQPDRAEREADAIAAAAGDPSGATLDRAAASLALRVRGRVEVLRHHHEEALAAYERAEELDPSCRGEVVFARLHLLWSAGRDDEVLRTVDELAASGELERMDLGEHERINVRSHRAMSAFRKGRVDEALAELKELVERAAANEDPGSEAAMRLNVATIERRAGSLRRALDELERAAALYDRAGRLAGLAQARSTLGGVLREVGELRRAEPLLTSAAQIRERIGDRTGAAVVRGMLGLLRFERGHARAGIEELERSADAIGGPQGRRFRPLLVARAEELRARIGAERVATMSNAEIDPRALLSWARAHWIRDDRAAAESALERGAALGKSLELRAVADEAALLGAALEGAQPTPPADDAEESLVAQDARLVDALFGGGELAVLRALAAELRERGRDDRAARAFAALASRETDGDARARAADAYRQCFARCTAGLSAAETLCLRKHLLGFPDPRPSELESGLDEDMESSEMDVLSLLEINHRLVEQQDLATLLGVIVENALSVTGAERGFLMLEENGELVFDTAMHSTRGGIARPEVEVSHSVVREALERMESVRVSNAVDDPLLAAAPSVVSLELRSILCAPFRVCAKVRGAIYVDHRVHADAFTKRSQRLLELLADQAALAISQVRRLEEIRQLNGKLEQRIVVQQTDLESARRALREVGLPAPAGGLVGDSSAMQAVRQLIERAARSSLSVLIHGSSGTGKELVARALHELSPRSAGPFVTENCAALLESLIESELFGYKRGAFTGAERDREGIFERASGGTLFLDEIGEMPIDLQAKLLRVLETGEVRRVGDDTPRKVDVRVVVATNRDLEREVREGRFREDVFYRLAALKIELPDLAQRTEDVPALVDHFMRLENAKSGTQRTISRAVLARLCRRPWPGNVRELRNEIARMCVLAEGDLDDPELVSEPGPLLSTPANSGGAVRTLADLERDAIVGALQRAGGDKARAAQMLGISRAKVYQRLKEWKDAGLDVDA